MARLAEILSKKLDIEIYELFVDPLSPQEEQDKLRQDIKGDMRLLFEEFIGKAPDGESCEVMH